MWSTLLIAALAAAAVAADSDPYEFDSSNTLFNRQTMVHLFEWKWDDVAKECEDFLQYNGYGAVQVSPPNEHIMIYTNNDVPWWVRYQPVSYRLNSRSGNESQFESMVKRCNKVGVRIIVDGVTNHMVGVGQKSGDPNTESSGTASFDGRDGVEQFPAVPYSSSDFHDSVCHGDIQGSDYQNNADNVRNCRLSGLLDLNHRSTHVRNMVNAYLTSLINIGVAGFRLDASKHMYPEDLQAILEKLPNLKADIFGANQRPFVVHEVIDRGGEAIKVNEYTPIGRYTNFNFGAAIASAIWKQTDVAGLSTLGPGFGYGNLDDHDVLNFIDNHDNQRDAQPYVLTYKNGDQYRMGNAFMLAWTYGYTRVMSSFDFKLHDQGPPNEGASNKYATKSPTFNPDNTCDARSGWVCEHRWPTIRQMAQFRAAAQGRAATQIVTETNRIAFARERSGFFAMNNGDSEWNRQFDTTLAAGSYCDQYDGQLQGSICTGATITVDNSGKASVRVPPRACIAFSAVSRIGGPPPPRNLPNGNYQKTAIFIQKKTQPGQNVFIRGGSAQAHQCSTGPFKQTTDPCSIPIVHNSTTPWMYATYRQWSQGDDYLDFEGEEQRQGTYDGTHAAGTPLAYSTNDAKSVDYQPLNKYGPDYWFVQLLMDCDKTENGWFELKGFMNGWESDIHQTTSCTGSIGGTNPLKNSNNHVAKCGAVGVFSWNANSCIVDSF